MIYSGIGVLSLPLLLMFSSLAVVPLSGPPLPLDPALSAVAPAECLWYTTSAGVAVPNPNSTNETELLFAEPEMRHFAIGLQKQLLSALRHGAGSRPERRVLAAEIPKLIQALIGRPLAAFVEDFQITADSLKVQAGLVLSAGEQRPEIEAAIGQLVELATAEGAIIGSIQQDGETWSMMRVSMQTPEIRWGWHDHYFILAVGDGTVETIVDRLTGAAPAWLEQLRRDYPVERESSVGYFNVELLLKRLKSLPKTDGDFGISVDWPVVEKLGLTRIQSFQSRSGFGEQGCVSLAQLVTDGQRRGLLSLLPYKELSANDLKGIPCDAMIAAAVRIDVSETWENIVRLVEEFDPNAAEQFERNLQRAETMTGVPLEDDVLGSLDDVWTAYLPTGDLMTSWLGTAVACKVKDAERLRTALKTLAADIRSKLPAEGRGSIKIRESEFEGQTISTVSVAGAPFPFTPAWCVTEDWLVLGLTPQTVRGLITRREQAEDSLADVPEVRQRFDSAAAPTSILYVDTPALARSLYPLVQMGAQMLSSQLAREGIEIDTSILPSSDTIIRHLRPGVTTMAYPKEGPYFDSQHSLPGSSSALAVAPLAVGTLLPSLWYARGEARRNQELMGLKQIALACLNYESANGHLPTNISDDDGEALLSWRVRILPYMEQQQALYNQFHLDEPWDSSHNKPLSELVLAFFASPESPTESKTRYLVLAGKKTLFPGDEELSFRHITDGSSQTILFVRAAPDAAVPWSKPEDIDFDAEQPFRSLLSPGGRFAVAYADGHCGWLTQAIGEDTMRAFATRAGGEVIGNR